MRSLFLIFILSLFFLANLLYPQNDAETLLNSFKEKFKTIEDFQCDFSQTAYSNFGDSYFIEGKFYYKKKNKFLIELPQAKIISDGKDIYNVDFLNKRAIINSLKNTPNAIVLDKLIDEVAKKSFVDIADDLPGLKGIILKPKNEDYNIKESKIYFDDNFIPKMFILIDNLDNLYEISFKNHKINFNISENLFKLENKYGLEIVDLR